MPSRTACKTSPLEDASSKAGIIWDLALNLLQKVRSINWHDLHNKLTKTDDVIAVLLGFDAPVILRPKANGHLEFVGEAYVHGLMNGDAILGPLPFGWQ